MATIQQLKDHLAANNDISYAFSQGLKKARTYGIPQLDLIKTVDDLINYFEEFSTWIPSEDAAGKVYYRNCLFYFVLDYAPLSSFQTPILPFSSAPWSWLSNWIINLALELGSFLNTPESLRSQRSIMQRRTIPWVTRWKRTTGRSACRSGRALRPSGPPRPASY